LQVDASDYPPRRYSIAEDAKRRKKTQLKAMIGMKRPKQAECFQGSGTFRTSGRGIKQKKKLKKRSPFFRCTRENPVRLTTPR